MRKGRARSPTETLDSYPVAEWLRVRTTHLLYQHDPCDVLLMFEVAEKHIRAEQKLNVKDYVEKP